MRHLLPAATGQGREPAEGRELRPMVNQRLFDGLTTLGRRAARQLNQLSQDRQNPG